MSEENSQIRFHDNLKIKMDNHVNYVYDLSKKFPKDELYGITSQLRRAVISIILNYIEGFARRRQKVLKNFLEISYGSLKETKYLLYFSYKRTWINKEEYNTAIEQADEIGKMLWGILIKL